MILLSKNIVVEMADGTRKNMNNITRIVTELQGTTNKCTWIPKDEIESDAENIMISFVNDRFYARVSLDDADDIYY